MVFFFFFFNKVLVMYSLGRSHLSLLSLVENNTVQSLETVIFSKIAFTVLFEAIKMNVCVSYEKLN